MKNNAIKQGYVIKKILPLAFANSPFLFVVEIFLFLIYSLYGVAIISATSNLFNLVQLKPAFDYELLRAILWLIIILISKELLGAFSDLIAKYICEISLTKFSELTHKKAYTIDPLIYEDPNFLDLVEKSEDGVYSVSYYVLNILSLFFYDIPYLMLIGLYLMKIKPLLFFTPFCVCIPVILNQLIKTKYHIKYKDEEAPLKRKKNSYKSYICELEYFKETRHLGCFQYFYSLYMYVSELLIKKQWKLDNKEQVVNIINKVITLLGYFVAIFMLYYSLMDNSISISIFATVFYSLSSVHSNIEHILSNRIGPIITDDFSAIISFIRFIELPNRKFGDVSIDTINLIEAKDIDFTYPGRNEPAISKVNFKFKRGQLVTLVGENGSGKTTLSKLILGLYKPDNGQIYLNNVNTDNITHESLFKNKSAVFQNFYKYYFNLADNISISDFDVTHDTVRLDKISNEIGIDVNSNVFPNGYNTILSKNFGGTDLSGGEWQKVAIARGYYRNNNIIVLDEPTAMIDPIQEEKMYLDIMNNVKNDKIVIVITHRMALVKQADIVIYMKGGKIIQKGTHKELLNNDSYREFFSTQAKWYQ